MRIEGEAFRHLIKARRSDIGDTLTLRNKAELSSYTYRIETIVRDEATASLVERLPEPSASTRALHLGWCIIDPKNIEKMLPQLVELGVETITFLTCDRTQRNFRLELSRWERIIDASMQQCGRTASMKLIEGKKVSDFLTANPHALILDFAPTPLDSTQISTTQTFLIGCEGGFSPNEQALFDPAKVRRLDTAHVLRSETAAVAIASLALL